MGADRTSPAPTRSTLDVATPRDDDGLVIVDGDGVVRLVDHRARELLGEDFQLGAVAPALVLDADAVTLRRRRGGRETAVELRMHPTQVDGGDGWAIAVADVSDRGVDRDEVSEFVSAVCHEMRTPLTGIIGYADALREGWDDLDEERRANFLGVILREGARLTRLTSDLGALSRPGRGIDVHPESVNLDHAIAETLAVLREDARGVEVAGDTGLLVRVDGSHLQNVLTNLLVNARKYGLPPIVVDVERQEFQGVVRVRDHGEGVAESFVPRMWERFSRGREGERPPGVPGSGLGLAVVTSLVAINGGHAWYEPNEPKGAAFCVAFPLALSEGSPPEGPPAEDPRAS